MAVPTNPRFRKRTEGWSRATYGSCTKSLLERANRHTHIFEALKESVMQGFQNIFDQGSRLLGQETT